MAKDVPEGEIDLDRLDPGLVELPLDLIGKGKDRDGDDEEEEGKDKPKSSRRGREEEEDEEERGSKDRDEEEELPEDEEEEGDDERDERDRDTRDDDRDRGYRRERNDEGAVVPLLMEQLKEMREEMRTLRESNRPSGISDAEWSKLEEKTGMSRAALELVMGTGQTAYRNARQEFEQRIARMERRQIISDLSHERGYEDAIRHEAEVEKFMASMPPHLQADRKLIKFAVDSARGRRYHDDIDRVRGERERDRRVVERFSDRRERGTRDRGDKGGGLTALQDKIRQQFGMSRKEYQSLKSRPSKRR